MDPRRAAYLGLATMSNSLPAGSVDIQEEVMRVAQVMRDGTQGEFWPHVQEQINVLIRQAEARFLDSVAADYPTYLQWFSRRQALIQILALPDRLIAEAARPKEG